MTSRPTPLAPPQTVPPARQAGGDASMLLGVLTLAAGATLLGLGPILVKLSDLGPQALAFWRFAMSLPVLAVWLAVESRGSAAPAASPKIGLLILAGVFFAGDLAFWHASIKITTAANAALLTNLTLILVPLAGWLLFRETITRHFMIAAAITLGGAILLSAGNIAIAPERLAGDGLAAFTAVWYAAYLITVRVARRGASAARVMIWSTAAGAPLSLVVALMFGEDLLPASLAGWAILVALGVVVHAGGQGAIAFGLGRVPAGLAALIILIQPLAAALLGWIIFGEALSGVQLAGAVLVLAGVYIAQRARTPKRN